MSSVIANGARVRSADQQALVDRASRAFPSGTVGTPVPEDYRFVASHGKGARIYDTDGREWIDHLLGSGPLILGHAHPAVTDAIAAQAARSTTHYTLTTVAIELAEEILSVVPQGQQLFFTSSGSEAVFYCLRLARAHTGRSKIVKFRGAYHGHNDYAMVEAFARPDAGSDPSSAGIPAGALDTVLVAEFNDEAGIRQLFEEHRSDIAAVVVEPYQRILEPRPGYLQLLRELTSRNGAFLIADEVVAGFRFHYGTAQAIYGVQADMTVFGKIVGGGLPLTAFTGPADVMKLAAKKAATAADGVYISGTLNGNAISAAAGLATLRELKRPGIYDTLDRVGVEVRDIVTKALARHGIPGTVVGRGPMWHPVLGVDEAPTSAAEIAQSDLKKTHTFGLNLIANGILVSPGIRAFLSTAHGPAEIESSAHAVDRALAALSD